MRAAVYVRISRDPEGLRAGVDRQRADCLAECERRGWDPIVFEDNDVSAYSGKPRPGYEAMLAAVRAGEVGALVAWAPDRLTRHLRELEGLVALVEATGIQVATTQGGDWDLATPEGRFMARQLGLLARLESEKLAARAARTKRQEAEAGRAHMGPIRPWGFEEDRVTHRPAEAAEVRAAAAQLLDGASLASVARAVGRPPDSVKKALRSPRMVGVRRHRGSEYPAVWEPILDRDTWLAVQAVLAGRKVPGREPGGARARRTLLAGFLVCGLCGGRCSGSRGDYSCDQCKRLRRLQWPVDEAVRDYVLARADLQVPAPGVDPGMLSAVRGFEARIEDLDREYLDGAEGMSAAVYARARGGLESRLAEAQDRLDEAGEATVWVDVRGEAWDWWERADLRQRRAIVAKHVDQVVIGRAIRGKPDEGIHIAPLD
jgi:site-specific DNA recombinase